MYIKKVQTYCEEAYVNSTTCATLFRGETINTEPKDLRTLGQGTQHKDPRTQGQGNTQGPGTRGPAVFYLATCVSVSKFKLMTVSL